MKKSLLPVALAATTAITMLALPGLPKEDAGGRLRVDAPASAALDLTNPLPVAELPSALRAPRAAADMTLPSGATLQGFLAYDAEEKMQLGWYAVKPTGETSLIWAWDAQFSQAGLSPRGAWFRNGRFCTHAVASYGGDQQIFGSLYMELDPATGRLLFNEVIDVYENPFSNIIAPVYVESEDKVYGFSVAPDGSKYSFSCAPAGKLIEATEIRRLDSPGDRCYSLAYNQDEKCFYGINFFDKLVRISMDGTSEEICAVPLTGISGDRGGLIYSPLDGCYFYNPQFYEKPSAIYAVYPAEKKFVLLNQFDTDKQFVSLYTPDNAAVLDAAPKAPTVKEVNFTAGNHEAAVVFTMPSATEAGAAIAATMTWKACVDSKQVATGTAAAGADVSVDFTTLADGFRALQFFVSDGTNTPNPAVATVFAGYDAPAMPTGVKLTDSKVSWTRVRRGEHNEYFDATDLSYTVYINGEKVGTSTTPSLDITLDPTKPVAAYTATVVATAHDIDSKPGLSNKLVFGAPMDLPISFEPTVSDFDLMTCFNLDGGAAYGEWCYSERWDRPCFSSGWSKDVDANDWLILPGAVFADADKAYRFSLEAACGGMSGKEEYFEVWLGTAPDPAMMRTPVISKTQVHSTDWESYSNLFGISQAGTYYIGIHAVSKANQYALNVSKIKVEATDLSARGPEVATGLAVTSTDHAKLTATVEFTLPTRYLTGLMIPEYKTLKATVSTEAGSVDVSGNPGATVSATVPTRQGDNVVLVKCFLEDAEGAACETIVFTGVDMPDYVENMKTQVTEDNMGIRFTWEAPLKGLNDGYFETTGLEYYIGEIDELGEFVEEPVLAGKDVFEYTYRLPAGAKLAHRRIALAASNAAGLSFARWYVGTVVGTPHTPPMVEGFDNMTFTYEPISIQTPTAEYTNGGWDWAQPELIDPAFNHGAGDFALTGYTDEAPARVRLSLPKFSTSNCSEALLTLDLWNGNGRASEVNVYGSTFGVNATLLESIPLGTGWEEYDVVLPQSLLNRPWVNILIDAKLPSENHYLILSGYSVNTTTGIGNVEAADSNAPVEYFNLQGMRVDNPGQGIFIRRQGNKVSKVLLKN